MTDPQRLTDRLQLLAPGTAIDLTWRNSHDTTTSASGTICNYDPTVTFRHVETEDRQLLLTTDTTTGDLTVTECTPAGAAPVGTLESLSVIAHPTEPLRLTDAGVEVPPYFVGYIGRLWIEHLWGETWAYIPEPGLQRYDTGLFADLEVEPKYSYDEISVSIRPSFGPKRHYETVDDRTLDSDPDPSPREQRYGEIETICTTVNDLSQAVFADSRLENPFRDRIGRRLHELQSRLLFARRIMLEPEPSIQPWDGDDPTAYTWDHYADALDRIEDETAALREAVGDDDALHRRHRSDARKRLENSDRIDEIKTLLALTDAETPAAEVTANE